MSTSTKRKGLLDAYRFPGCRPQARLRGVFGDPKARVITLTRRSKKRFAVCAPPFTGVSTTAPGGRFAICRAATCASISITYEREGWARRFFENWRASLKWQRLKPYEKFAQMIDRHWDGIAAYCKPENKVALGFVEGLNNKIRVIQRRAYGLRDEEYLRLKILTCMLPAL